MFDAPVPLDEQKRIEAVKDLAILDTAPEKRFDRITSLAIHFFHVPISTLTIMDTEREWYKSCQGVDAKEGPRAISFCGHVIASRDEMVIITDTKDDSRFADNPMVIGPPFVRFYAGVPIFDINGMRVGAFCIKDTKPRSLSEAESFFLQTLASWAELEVNFAAVQKVINGKVGQEKMKPVLERLKRRNVLDNLQTIRFGLALYTEGWSEQERTETKEAIEYIVRLIEKIRMFVEQKIL